MRSGIVTVWVGRVPIQVWVEVDTERNQRIRESYLKKPPNNVADIRFGPSMRVMPSEEYSKWSRYIPRSVRREVIARDRVCRDCAKEGEHVHHLSYNPPIAANNLVYLCEGCHAERHRAITRPIYDAARAAFERDEKEAQASVPEAAKNRAPWPF